MAHFQTRTAAVRRLLLLLAGAWCLGCAGTPSARNAQQAPLWVTDPGAGFPDSEWLCVVESGADKKSAESAALVSLARVFRVDLNAVTSANQKFAQAIAVAGGGKKIPVSSESRDFAQELVSVSNVSGLIGVRQDVWTAPNSTVYANARMNRRECAARYSAMIRENETVINRMKEMAEQNPATFDAYEALVCAAGVAEAADQFQNLLTVLDPAAITKRPAYGNAAAVQELARNAARAIIITVQVEGDVDGRVAKAYGGYFTARGFRTNEAGANPYRLAAVLQMEEAALGNPNNKFVRYVLNCSVKNRDGVAVFDHSGNGREGHISVAEARQRALRAVETAIAVNFAHDFDAYLASLLQ
jgi:hypothetical protein